MKYQVRIDLQLKGNQGLPTERAHGLFHSGPRNLPASNLSASIPAFRRFCSYNSNLSSISIFTLTRPDAKRVNRRGFSLQEIEPSPLS